MYGVTEEGGKGQAHKPDGVTTARPERSRDGDEGGDSGGRTGGPHTHGSRNVGGEARRAAEEEDAENRTTDEPQRAVVGQRR